ncbi:MAG: PadR family transcriptional regulator [Nostocoides sp.]
MSVKQGLLALLSEGPMFGAQLRSEFEGRTGGTWPLNIGQVYTTLSRLERDNLVEYDGPADTEGRIRYRLTANGQAAVARWWAAPVNRSDTPRNELVIKLALAITAPGVDVHDIATRQRTATLTHLRDLTRLKQRALDALADTTGTANQPRPAVQASDKSATLPGNQDLAWLLVLENLIFAAEAEVRWLDHVESRLVQGARVDAPSTGPSIEANTTPFHQVAPRPPDAAPASTPPDTGSMPTR